ncbi:hypothetical protein HWV62_10637 [Athelia sp. TMB]|nr:hypothetical protein HWV62_10637 [Athelia sp. TMB]
MSASWNKRIYNPPALPVELWLRIIESATSVPGILEPEMYKISELPNAETIRLQQSELRASLVTKRNLVRVSKAWYAMAAPHLYETILIDGQRTLMTLCTTLTHSKEKGETSSGKSHPLGWYAKRLDFAIRDSETRFLEDLAKVIRYLPNLTMFNFTPRGYVTFATADVAHALAETCGHSLRQLFLSNHCLEERDWSKHGLAGLPSLRSGAAAPLTNLRSLVVLWAFSYVFPWKHSDSLPNLEHLELPSRENFDALSACTPMPIRVLFLHIRRIYDYPRQWPDIERDFPNVSRLVVSLDEWEGLLLRVPPSVTYLALCCRRPQEKANNFSEVFRVLATLKSPRLKVVRFADRRVGVELRTRHTAVLAQGLEQIRLTCSFVLEDCEGRPF